MDLPTQTPAWTAIRRAALSVITALVLLVMGSSLVSSWQAPQVTGELQLYQSNLLLQASEWQGSGLSQADQQRIRTALLGQNPLETVAAAYTELREDVAETLARSLNPSPQTLPQKAPEKAIAALSQQQTLLAKIDLRLGLLAAEQGDPAAAVERWQAVADREATPALLAATATTLADLWQGTPPPDAEVLLQSQLDGWFCDRALAQLYAQQGQTEALVNLQQRVQIAAQATLFKVVAISTLPAVGSVVGAGLLLFLGFQWLWQRDTALLGQKLAGWNVPWTWETIWQVLVVGFFFIGQIAIPLLLGGLGLSAGTSRGRAVFSMAYYLLMAAGSVTVLFFSVRAYRPLPEGWFRIRIFDRWPLWGIGGYLVALPTMIVVSLANQQIWQGQGGSNPLLQTVVEESDPVALLLFFLTAALAAPLFEEFLFRGFLLPSLTRYLPTWGAILLSSFVFAAAHLSLSEVIPLMTLGCILGYVYGRSRNLLAPMLLHSAWNSVTMIGLLLLGS